MNWFKNLFTNIAKHKKHYWTFVKMTLLFTVCMFGGINLLMFITSSAEIYTIWMALKIALVMSSLDLIVGIRVDNEVERRVAEIETEKEIEANIANRHIKIKPEAI